MKIESTHKLLDDLSSTINVHIDLSVSTFQNLASEELLKPSASGGWSIAQCLDHLNSYGDFYLPQIIKALEKSKGHPEAEFRSGWLGAYFIQMMKPSAKKYKAVKSHSPVPELDAHGVVARFIDQQEMLLNYTRDAAQSSLNTRVSLSVAPIVKLKLGDIFKFIVVHDERHLRQALRNLNVADFLTPLPF